MTDLTTLMAYWDKRAGMISGPVYWVVGKSLTNLQDAIAVVDQAGYDKIRECSWIKEHSTIVTSRSQAMMAIQMSLPKSKKIT